MRGAASAASIVPSMAGVVAASALVFGGGRGGIGDAAVQLLSVALLACLWWHRRTLAPPPMAWWPVAAVIAIPVLQLLPIPASTWLQLGGRGEIANDLAAAGAQVPFRLGLDPTASERALAWLLPGVALYLATACMEPRHQRRLLGIALAVACASVALGSVQVAAEPGSILRFHQPTNASGMVGFFANRNHAAALLAAAIPIAVAFIDRATERRDLARGALRIAVAWASLALLVAGLSMTRSRAGIAIGFGVLCLSPLLKGRGTDAGPWRRRIAAAGLVALLGGGVAAAFALQRVGLEAVDGGRSAYQAAAIDAGNHFLPTGSGLGTFRQVYAPFEHALGHTGQAIVHHAHNDYLELWVESGWFVVPCLLALLGFQAWATTAAWRDRSRDAGWRRAASLSLLVPVLHSALDYPLRTTSHLAACGLLLGVVAGALLRDPSHESAR